MVVVKKDLFRKWGVRIPGGEENDPGSGCVIRGERGSRVQAIPCRARKGEWVSCPNDPV